jgi:hypothetical protein
METHFESVCTFLRYFNLFILATKKLILFDKVFRIFPIDFYSQVLFRSWLTGHTKQTLILRFKFVPCIKSNYFEKLLVVLILML